MSRVILDTSAFLAFANRETGAEKVRPILKESVVSAVNAAEILQKLVMKNMTLSRAEEYLKRFVSDIPPFDLEQAALTATLRAQTREFGLSLGDRACVSGDMDFSCSDVDEEERFSADFGGLRVLRLGKTMLSKDAWSLTTRLPLRGQRFPVAPKSLEIEAFDIQTSLAHIRVHLITKLPQTLCHRAVATQSQLRLLLFSPGIAASGVASHATPTAILLPPTPLKL